MKNNNTLKDVILGVIANKIYTPRSFLTRKIYNDIWIKIAVYGGIVASAPLRYEILHQIKEVYENQ